MVTSRKYILTSFNYDDLTKPIKLEFSDVDMEILTFEDFVGKLMKRLNPNSELKIIKGYDFYGNNIAYYSNYYNTNKSKKLGLFASLFSITFKARDVRNMKVNLILKTEKGTEVRIEFSIDETVLALKQLICQKYSHKVEEQELSFKKIPLKNENFILEYDIEEGSVIDYKLAVKQGYDLESFTAEVVDFSKNIFTNKSFNKEAPKYRIVGNGLNLEGICPNSMCEANGEMVIIPICEYGVFDFIFDLDKVNCPLCKKHVPVIENCGFTSCLYAWTGIYIDEAGDLQKFDQPNFQKIGNYYHLYESKASGKRKWKSLKLIIKPNEEDLDSTLPEEVPFCKLCNNVKGLGETPKNKFDCNHSYHDECFKQVQNCLCKL